MLFRTSHKNSVTYSIITAFFFRKEYQTISMSAIGSNRTCRFPDAIDAAQRELYRGSYYLRSNAMRGGLAMYSLIIIFAILSPATGSVVPVGVSSQILAKFETLDQCKEAGNKQGAGGATSVLMFSRGIYWHCGYAGPR